jgi:hypothetical protein
MSPRIFFILMQFCFFFADPPPQVEAKNPPAPKTPTAPRNPTLPDGRHRHFCVVYLYLYTSYLDILLPNS